jgi:hypothetical protein
MGDYLEISSELKEKIETHYSRPEIISAMLKASSNKEVVGSFGGVGYGKRPDILEYENDIGVLIKKGVTSFHISEETWRNPLELSAGLEKKKLDPMRIGWDLIIDIDCPHWLISKTITHHIIQKIKESGVDNVSVKFSGNKGFHIGIPQESFPKEFWKDFPDLPRKISAYLLDQIFDKASKDLIKILKSEFGNDFHDKAEELFGKKREQLFKKTDLGEMLDPFSIIEVDTLLISSRHLYRMVYSVNEKSGLVSIPFNPDKVLQFEKDIAKIENKVFSKFKFLDRELSKNDEAMRLCIEAIDANVDISKDFKKEYDEKYSEKSLAQMEFEEIKEKIPELCFPESIKKILEGNLSDGKKRSLFILRNFLNCVGWSYSEIEARINTWNETHAEPLRNAVLKGQLIYLKNKMQKGEKMLPPNYSSQNYYADIIGTLPEYKKAKNPVSLALKIFNTSKKNSKKSNTSKK